MARFEERMWEGNFSGMTRRDRMPCRYSVYLPDFLAYRPSAFDGDVTTDMECLAKYEQQLEEDKRWGHQRSISGL